MLKLMKWEQWLIRIKDVIYSLSVILVVPFTAFSYFLSNLEAKEFGFQYIIENFSSALFVTIGVSIVVIVIAVLYKILDLIFKRKK